MSWVVDFMCEKFGHQYKTKEIKGLTTFNICQRCGEEMRYTALLEPMVFGALKEKNT